MSPTTTPSDTTAPVHVPAILLNDGLSMPQLGFGVWQVGDEKIVPSVSAALDAGYRSIDTAAAYGNERGVGEAIRASGVPREEIFLTTKLWSDKHDNALAGIDESLAKLGQDRLDLYLIHWPRPKQGLYVEAWKGLIRCREEGKTRSIGVSNYTQAHEEEIIAATGVIPAVNQIELHPYFQQRAMRAYHADKGIVTESWSPLGQGGEVLKDPVIVGIAETHGRTPAQVVLRWHMELGLVTIPKSVTPERIRENLDVFDFHLTSEDMARIEGLDRGERLGGDPDTADW